MTNWHGWTHPDSDVTVCVGPLPGRTRIAAYVQERHAPNGSSIHSMAYFRTPEDAARFLAAMDDVLQLRVPTSGSMTHDELRALSRLLHRFFATDGDSDTTDAQVLHVMDEVDLRLAGIGGQSNGD